MYLLLKAILPYLPADIHTVHEYGNGWGGGTRLLQKLYPNAKGFDTAPRWEHTIVGDATDPKEDADLILSCHMFEKSYSFDVQTALDAQLDHCRYLGISVYTNHSKLNGIDLDCIQQIHQSIDDKMCYPEDESANKHDRTYYLLRGRL